MLMQSLSRHFVVLAECMLQVVKTSFANACNIYIYKETRALRALCLLGCLSQLEEVQP
jgi:hypothetical protein